MAKVIIAGGRDFDDYELLKSTCLKVLRTALKRYRKRIEDLYILEGDCKGADKLAKRFAIEMDTLHAIYPAQWHLHGKAAGPIRNRQMAENADALIAFWDGASPGTANMIKVAKELGLEVIVIEY